MALVRGLELARESPDIKRICAGALADVIETYEDAFPLGDYLFDLNEEPQAVAKRLAKIGKEMPK